VGATGTITCTALTALQPASSSTDPVNSAIFRLVLKANAASGNFTNVASASTSTFDLNPLNNDGMSSMTTIGNVCSFTAGCLNDMSVIPDTMCSGVPGKVLTFSAPATMGTCGAFTFTPASGSCFPTGTTTVVVSEQNTATCSFRVIVGSPTAAGSAVSGTIVDNQGNAVEGVTINLSGSETHKTITDANGFYRFDNVETNGFYTVTPSRVNYSFNPASRSFSQLGETTQAAFGAALASSNLVNPLDTPEYFVRQHYIDFLGREPDEAGFNFWSDQILECGTDQNCSERHRENVSAAYFLSIEFQQTGGLVDGLYRASYGVAPQYAAFMPDVRAVGLGVVVGSPGWEAKLRTNKEAFVNAFVNRPAFHQIYDGVDNSLYVDTLIQHTGVSFTAAERDALVSGLGTGTMTRAEALRRIAENQSFISAKFNQAFVLMEYFGYLQREPDASGYAFWLNKLNGFNGNFEQAEMVKAFIVSGEYRERFLR
jgi:Carboxypeptidase regulatory-like domain/Domain of unknown function (DUF4214)